VNCGQVQRNLSLYLYGELAFADEEAFEAHVAECAFCARALAREKSWHSALNAGQRDVPLDLLAACRRDLQLAVAGEAEGGRAKERFWTSWFRVPNFNWSAGLAVASLLLFIGFTAGRWADRNGVPAIFSDTDQMSVIQPGVARVRDIQPMSDHRVHIIVDQIRQREITGSIDDGPVRQLLIQAVQDAGDPGLRVDSVEVLTGENDRDVRRVLVETAEHDPNAAVRLKAVEALQPFADEPDARAALVSVLEHDTDPGVRTEAIDALAPAAASIGFDPQLAGTLEQVVRSPDDSDYLRLRCLQILNQMQASFGVQ
jgi:hypothetical protein